MNLYNLEDATDDVKAAWIQGFLMAFGRIAFVTNQEPYVAFVRVCNELTPTEILKQSLIDHPPHRCDNFTSGSITPVQDILPRLTRDLYPWLFRFLGYRCGGNDDEDGYVDPKQERYTNVPARFYLMEKKYRSRLVTDLANEILKVAKPTGCWRLKNSTEVNFCFRSKNATWLLVTSTLG